MAKEPRWISNKAALAIHGMLLARHGGKSGVLDDGSLDAARNHFAYERASLYRLAAVYAHGINQNHPFADGNKRVALTVAITFLELNGLRFKATEQEAAAAMYELAAGSMNRDGFEAWLKASCERPRKAE